MYSEINLIVAHDLNNGIGCNNTLPWKQKADLIRFKNLTSNQTVLMGRKTFESLGCKPLPNRKNIVLSNSLTNIDNEPNLEITNKVDFSKGQGILWIIGGAQIYEKYLYEVDNLYVTQIYTECEADAFFPPIDESLFDIQYTKWFEKDLTNEFKYRYLIYKRK